MTTFKTLVEYRKPSYKELCKQFDSIFYPCDSVNDLPNFEPIEACKNVSLETRELEFELLQLDLGIEKTPSRPCSCEVPRLLAERGLRPALYEELVAFAAQHAGVLKTFAVIAFGSVRASGRRGDVPRVDAFDSRRLKYSYVCDCDHELYRFLAVRV